ncbi:hypothetical protein EDC55_1222 [Allofrancisella inopinata]|uniref:Lipoprotein n=1 Tax=Allofrancisella inopinata TaxID=1085647 RepID=A0AAE6YH80_9GAMM|nr:hypothetical protein [Allofrancisella inopinata]QIV95720.1 hypothetical protein E4K63_02290 [Allofrancisella inopinata]TDT67945.1 hypothetical protein EDC55_1222 [Allofrancisella inopinata]
MITKISKKFFILTLLLSIMLLTSCAKSLWLGSKLSDKATKQQQEQVKQEVMELLEKEYNQPFKLLNYKYEYKRHYDLGGNCHYCDVVKYGTYYFNIKAVNNPIIVMDFRIDDMKNSSTNELIEGFKKDQLKYLYCIALAQHYIDEKKLLTDKLTDIEVTTNNYCDLRNQKEVYDNAWTR